MNTVTPGVRIVKAPRPWPRPRPRPDEDLEPWRNERAKGR